MPCLVWHERPVFDTGEIEKVGRPGRAVPLHLYRARELVPLTARPVDVALPEASGGGEDRSQGRAKLVRDRVKQLGLEVVGTTKHLGLRRLLAETRALDGEAQLCRRDREQPLVSRRELGRADSGQDPERADAVVRGNDRNHAGACVTCGSARPVRADEAYPPGGPAGIQQTKLSAGRPKGLSSHIVAGRDRGVRKDLGVGFDRHSVEIERIAEVLGDAYERGPEIGSAIRKAASYRIFASCSRCSASCARARSRAASVPVTTAVMRKSASEMSSSGSATTSWCVGWTKNQSNVRNARMLATIAAARPNTTATTSTATR